MAVTRATRWWGRVPVTGEEPVNDNVVPMPAPATPSLGDLRRDLRAAEDSFMVADTGYARAALDRNNELKRLLQARRAYAGRHLDDVGARVSWGVTPELLPLPGQREDIDYENTPRTTRTGYEGEE